MKYCFLKIIIKSLLFFIILSVIENLKEYIVNFEQGSFVFDLTNVRLYNANELHILCHYMMFSYINKSFYKINYNTETMADRMTDLRLYNLRLLRFYYHGHPSKMKFFGINNWNFFVTLNKWTNDYTNTKKEEELINLARIIIDDAEGYGLWNLIQNPSDENILKDFLYCEEHLFELSKSSTFMEESLCDIIIKHTPHINETREFPIYILYGAIFILMKEEEYTNEFELLKEINDKKIFLIDIMKEAQENILNTVNEIMCRFINDIRRLHGIAMFQIHIENRIGIFLQIIISIYKQAIDTTQVLYNINENRSKYPCRVKSEFSSIQYQPPDIRSIYTFFMNEFKTKLNNTFPNGPSFACTPKSTPSKPQSFSDGFSEAHGCLCPGCTEGDGRLTTHDINNKNILFFPLFRYYTALYDKCHIEPYFTKLVSKNKTIVLLLELKAWMLILDKYARLMANDDFLEHNELFGVDNMAEMLNEDRKCIDDWHNSLLNTSSSSSNNKKNKKRKRNLTTRSKAKGIGVNRGESLIKLGPP